MEIIHGSSENFDSVLRQNKLVLVDFWASWCGPCRMMAPIVESISEKYDDKLAVVKVDVDEQQSLAMQYGIQSIPTLILFKDGKQLWTEVGVKPQGHLEGLIEAEL